MNPLLTFFFGLLAGLLVALAVTIYSGHCQGELWRKLWEERNPGKPFDPDLMTPDDRAIFFSYFTTNTGPN